MFVCTNAMMCIILQHDTTVNAFLRTLGIFNDRKPQYTACVIVELHEPTKGDYFVKILYKNETLYNETVSQRVPYILKLNGMYIRWHLLKRLSHVVTGSTSDSRTRAPGFDTQSCYTFSFHLLIQEGQLSITRERICT